MLDRPFIQLVLSIPNRLFITAARRPRSRLTLAQVEVIRRQTTLRPFSQPLQFFLSTNLLPLRRLTRALPLLSTCDHVTQTFGPAHLPLSRCGVRRNFLLLHYPPLLVLLHLSSKLLSLLFSSQFPSGLLNFFLQLRLLRLPPLQLHRMLFYFIVNAHRAVKRSIPLHLPLPLLSSLPLSLRVRRQTSALASLPLPLLRLPLHRLVNFLIVHAQLHLLPAH